MSSEPWGILLQILVTICPAIVLVAMLFTRRLTLFHTAPSTSGDENIRTVGVSVSSSTPSPNGSSLSNSCELCTVTMSVAPGFDLSVRSWWPSQTPAEVVRRKGITVALQSARNWLNDNRQRPSVARRLRAAYSMPPEMVETMVHEHATSAPASSDEDSEVPSEPCAICLCGFDSDSQSLGQARITKACKHRFHAACLTKWCSSNETFSCPMCRSELLADVPHDVVAKYRRKPSTSIRVTSARIERVPRPTDSTRSE